MDARLFPRSDDKTKRGPQDRSRINVHEGYEVTYWCQKFGCSRAELVAAVAVVGVMANAVAEHFRKNPPKG